jgi:HEAT repeat protein
VVVNQHVPPAPTPQPASTLVTQAQQRKRSELLEQLRIGDNGNRLSATQQLAGYTGDEKVREALERALLSDRDAGVRAATASALGKQSGKKAVPALKQAYAQDAERQVQQAAYKALIMIEGY